MDAAIDHRFETHIVTATLVVVDDSKHRCAPTDVIAALRAKDYTVTPPGDTVSLHEVCVVGTSDDYLDVLVSNPWIDFVLTDCCVAFRYLLDYDSDYRHVEYFTHEQP